MLRAILTTVLVAFVLGTGCASAAKKPISARASKAVPPSTALRDAEELERRAKYLDAGLAYAHLSNRTTAPEKQELQLRAVETLLRGNYTAQAAQILGEVDTQGQSAELTERKMLAQVRIDLARGRRERVMPTLDTLERGAVTNTTRIAVHTLKAETLEQAGQKLESARERAKLDVLLTEGTARKDNRAELLQTLVDLPEATLQRARTPGVDAFTGWVELALIVKANQNSPQELSRRVAEWKLRYPYHGASDFVDSRYSAQDPARTGRMPKTIALLLPGQGAFAKAGDAVREGFLAAYFAAGDAHPRPAILLYDSGATAGDIVGVYQRAVRDGAEFVVGPLDKSAVAVLAQQGDLDVPTLALNYADHTDVPRNLYQFGLSPEDEAAQTAERAWLDGHERAAALVQEGALGERLLNAFKMRWIELGGEFVEAQTYSTRDNDLSPPIKKILDIDLSEQRRTALKTALGYDIKFSPRRRQDVDFVFIAALPKHARLIRPQLNFYQASSIPVYGTSHVFSGVVNVQVDHDMDNVTFGDMPWVLPKAKRNTALFAKISQLWPQQAEANMRLYALGIDAYNLIGLLDSLASQQSAQFAGETGGLYLDDAQRVLRRLAWAEFRKGAPRLLE